MWLDHLFNHLVIDKWPQTDIFSGVAAPGEGLAAADPGLRWGGCRSGGGAAAPTSPLARGPMYAKPSSEGRRVGKVVGRTVSVRWSAHYYKNNTKETHVQ